MAQSPENREENLTKPGKNIFNSLIGTFSVRVCFLPSTGRGIPISTRDQ